VELAVRMASGGRHHRGERPVASDIYIPPNDWEIVKSGADPRRLKESAWP
jgi:hypothetical protein